MSFGVEQGVVEVEVEVEVKVEVEAAVVAVVLLSSILVVGVVRSSTSSRFFCLRVDAKCGATQMQLLTWRPPSNKLPR